MMDDEELGEAIRLKVGSAPDSLWWTYLASAARRILSAEMAKPLTPEDVPSVEEIIEGFRREYIRRSQSGMGTGALYEMCATVARDTMIRLMVPKPAINPLVLEAFKVLYPDGDWTTCAEVTRDQARAVAAWKEEK